MPDHIKMIRPQELACCTEYVRIKAKDIDTYLAQGWQCVSYHYGICGNETYVAGYTLAR